MSFNWVTYGSILSEDSLKMSQNIFLVVLAVVIFSNLGDGQVLQFGMCPEVETVKYFDLERVSLKL